MTKAASLIALVTFSTVSAFAQTTNSRSARSVALNYVLLHEFAYITGADFELAGETTDALTPGALRNSQPTDAIQLNGAASTIPPWTARFTPRSMISWHPMSPMAMTPTEM